MSVTIDTSPEGLTELRRVYGDAPTLLALIDALEATRVALRKAREFIAEECIEGFEPLVLKTIDAALGR